MRLRCECTPTAQVSDSVLEEIAEVCRRYVDASADDFRKHLFEQEKVWLFRDGSGVLRALFATREERAKVAGVPVLFAHLSMFYALPGARGSASFMFAAWRYVLRLWLRHPRRRLFAVSGVGAHSWRWFRANMRSVWTSRHEQIPALERALVDELAKGLPEWDGSRRTLRTRWRRKRDAGDALEGEGRRPSDRMVQIQSEFEALLPGPESDECLLLVGELSYRNLYPALRNVARRALR